MNFSIDNKTLKKINEWVDSLPKTDNIGAIGGRLSYSFTNTSIGQILKVKDNVSGEEKDFTNYDEW